jgi:hypothetical protein
MARTKGPWRYDSANCAIVSETEMRDFGDGDCFPVTIFTLYSACGGADSAADIALATASPDMLAALEAIEGYLANKADNGCTVAGGMHAMAMAAIGKAKGVQS